MCLFTDSHLLDIDNIVSFENTTPINQNKRMQRRLIRLIEVIFSKGTMLSVLDKSESVNVSTHTDQQKSQIKYSRGSSEVQMN